MILKKEWNQIKEIGHYGSFSFSGIATDWNTAVSLHFKTSTLERPYYGVYIVNQKSTGNIIYIGKSGTMCQDGSFKEQDIPRRLVNKEKGQSRKYVFGKRVVNYGELLIEYVIMKSESELPGYLEARLLQAYYDEHKKLPVDNVSF